MAISRPLDTLLAFKAIALMPKLSAAERRVAAAIVDHFRRGDGRCDPGVERLANLLARFAQNRAAVHRSDVCVQVDTPAAGSDINHAHAGTVRCAQTESSAS